MKLTKQMLHEMIEETLNEVSDPEFERGRQDGEAAGMDLIKSDPRGEIKNADEIHWDTIDQNAPDEGSYREGYIMGYGSRWMGIHGTTVSSDIPIYPPVGKFKDSPPVNRDFNKWEP